MSATPISGFPGTLDQLAGDEVFGPEQVYLGQWPLDGFSGRPIPKDALFNAPPARIVLKGAFQRFDLIEGSRDEIRNSWFRPSTSYETRPATDFVICLRYENPDPTRHIDGFEPVQKASIFDAGEIRRLIKTVDHQNLYLCCSDSDSERFARSLGKIRAEIVRLSEWEEFLFVRSFRKIAISQSALNWWSAFLSDADEIYFPRCKRGIWSHPGAASNVFDPIYYGVDLRVDDPRFIYQW